MAGLLVFENRHLEFSRPWGVAAESYEVAALELELVGRVGSHQDGLLTAQHETALRALEIVEAYRVCAHHEPAVLVGDSRSLQRQVTLGVAPDEHDIALRSEYLTGAVPRADG